MGPPGWSVNADFVPAPVIQRNEDAEGSRAPGGEVGLLENLDQRNFFRGARAFLVNPPVATLHEVTPPRLSRNDSAVLSLRSCRIRSALQANSDGDPHGKSQSRPTEPQDVTRRARTVGS